MVAWLKQFPAHAPTLLPMGLVTADDFITPQHRHLMYLPAAKLRDAFAASRAAMAPVDPSRVRRGPKVSLRSVIPQLGQIEVHKLDECGPNRCHHAGWCGRWTPHRLGEWDAVAGRQLSCFCLRHWEQARVELPLHARHPSVTLARYCL